MGIFDFVDLMIPDAAVDVDIQEHSFEHGFSGDVHLFGPPISGEEVVNEFPDDWSPLPHRTGDATGSDVASLLGDGSSRALPGDSVVSGSLSGEPVTTQPVVSAEVHDAIFSRSLLTNCDVTGVTLPWETGIFREIFSDEPFADQLVPKMPISNLCNVSLGDDPQQVAATVASVAVLDSEDFIFAKCISSGDDAHYHEMRQQLRDAAIGKLLIVLRHCLLASKTGRHIIGLGTDAQQKAGAYDIVDSVIGVRSPNTVVKRANSLLSFLRWVAKTGIDEVNPFVEQVIWGYFQHLRNTEAAATKADSSLSAFRFAFYVLGFDSLEHVVCSRRLVGAAEIMLSGKRLLRQSLALTVHQVKCLHMALRDKKRHPTDRALVGYLLFCLYGRCRNSDMQAIHKLETDFNDAGGFVVITTCNHKSGRMASLKTKLLPIVIPARGVDGTVWPQDALKAMQDAGCVFENPIDGPFMHAPANGFGDFMKRALRASEVSSALRRFLSLDEPSPGCADEIVSSHSLKATLLAWSARFGLSPQTRSMLGRHSSCLSETFAIYSRDLVCAPVTELQGVIDAVHSGSFFPDDQRSGFFKDAMGARPAHSVVKVEHDEFCRGLSVCSSPYEPSVAEVDVQNCSKDVGVSGSAQPGYPCEAVEEGPNVCGVDGKNDPTDLNGDGDDTDSSSSGSDALSSDHSVVADPPARVKRFRARIPADERWYVHSKSHLIHRFDGTCHNAMRFLVCGKLLTDAYALCTEATAWNTLCRSCNRR